MLVMRVLFLIGFGLISNLYTASLKDVAQSLQELSDEDDEDFLAGENVDEDFIEPPQEISPSIKINNTPPWQPSKKLEKEVNKKVEKEFRYGELRARRKLVKANLQGRVKFYDKKRMRSDLIYKITTWPFAAQYYCEKDLLASWFVAQFATQSYGSSGRTQDITNLVFGEKQILLKDILLPSKLLLEGSLAAPSATRNGVAGTQFHYLYVLANQPLDFDGSTNRQQLSLNYARHFKNDSISLGFEIPIVRRHNRFRLVSSISTVDRENLQRSTPAFYNLFNDLEAFFEDILHQQNRNISYNKRDTEWGIGDVAAFINLELKTHLERFVVGLKATFPTAQQRITERLWFPERGNGGFMELSPFIGLLWNGGKWFWNPHVYCQFTYSIPATVSRRIPLRETYTPSPAHPVGSPVLDFLDFGKSFNGTEVTFAASYDDFDSRIRNFPATIKDVKLHKGSEMLLRAGNIFEHFFSRKAFIDLYFDFRLKGKDYLGRFCDPNYDPSIITGNTFNVEYKAGLNAQYQFDSHKRMDGGVTYIFAGRNVPRTFELNAALSIAF
jgi:hypothetical protein